ncbi:MAG: LysM peptidoglycan-binding domain-containing protein [Anaerolineae bacterium]
MIEEKSIRQKDILVGLGIGLGVLLFVLVSVFLLLRPAPEAEPGTPAVTLTFAPLPTATWTPGGTASPAVPTPTPEVEVSPTPTSVTYYITYTVKTGDTLSGIAYDYGISTAALAAANDIAGEVIYPDQELRIPLDEQAMADLTATPTPSADEANKVVHTVKAGDTLSEIAKSYEVTVDEIVAANDLGSDIIWVGQELTIPVPPPPPTETPTATATPTATSTPTITPTPTWGPTILEGDLGLAYPETDGPRRFTLHYRAGMYGVEDIDTVQAMVANGMEHIEGTFSAMLPGTFDIYVAGTIFAEPDTLRRGRTFPEARQIFFLHDGTGTPEDQRYTLIRELTHLYAWHMFGPPTSTLVSEGLAVYLGTMSIADSDRIPLEKFCAAYHQADKLPRVSRPLRFENHILDLHNYYATGCFVQYLVETYEMEKFRTLYSSGDYEGIYGASLETLEEDWIADIEVSVVSIPFEAEALVNAVAAVGRAYTTLFANFRGTEAQLAAYQTLDAARIALLEGDLATVDEKLAELR